MNVSGRHASLMLSSLIVWDSLRIYYIRDSFQGLHGLPD